MFSGCVVCGLWLCLCCVVCLRVVLCGVSVCVYWCIRSYLQFSFSCEVVCVCVFSKSEFEMCDAWVLRFFLSRLVLNSCDSVLLK